ncbi:MAG: alpha/beta fold hydrolase [Baekduiaceae bacterium]
MLVHGLGGDRGIWAPVLGALASSHDVIAVDLPGFGRSAARPEDPPPAPVRRAGALAELLDALALDRVHVAGNSLGGWVGLELARLGRALSVCGIAPAGFWGRPLPPKPFVAHHVSRALRPVLRPAIHGSARLRHRALTGVVGDPSRVPAADAERIIRAYADGPGFVAVNKAMRAAEPLRDRDGIDVPITIAWCELDRLVRPPRTMPFAVERSVVLPGCGHVPMWDDPDAIAGIVRASADATVNPAR